jgi:hypothetical protein
VSETAPCCQCARPTDADRQPCHRCRSTMRARTDGLRYARLAPLPSAMLWKDWSPLAMLGGIEISHGHSYYWVAKGDVPLAVARSIYADPVGRDLIRAGGGCDCREPETLTEWRLPDGRKVLRTKERTECEALKDGSGPVARIAQNILADYEFSDEPASIGAAGFVTLYHIDGDLGLRVFVDIVRASAMEVPRAD